MKVREQHDRQRKLRDTHKQTKRQKQTDTHTRSYNKHTHITYTYTTKTHTQQKHTEGTHTERTHTEQTLTEQTLTEQSHKHANKQTHTHRCCSCFVVILPPPGDVCFNSFAAKKVTRLVVKYTSLQSLT